MIVTLALSSLLAVAPPPGSDIAPYLYPSLRNDPDSKDGTATPEWTGPGSAQLRIAQGFQRKRDEQLAVSDAKLDALNKAVQAFYKATGERAPTELRDRIIKLAGKPLDEARVAMLAAADLEARRLKYVQKAAASAAEQEQKVPEVDLKLVDRRSEAHDAGAANRAVEARIRAYRSMATGLVAYLDGDVVEALERMKTAGSEAPDLLLPHIYLGSFYYLLQQTSLAIPEWKAALELDPTNEAVKKALKEHSIEHR
ncbi:MAG: hypothetical protein ACYC8T_25300 [Myxococcaceae bacterium]